MPTRKLWQALFAGFLLALLALQAAAGAASADTFGVTKTADTADGTCDSDCSLREAIIAANASLVPVTITLGPGVYPLSRYGPDEDAADTGDLDILADLTIIGAGADKTIIDGLRNGGVTDRVFDILPHLVQGASGVRISGVTIRNGGVDTSGSCWAAFGGGIRSRDVNLTLKGVILTGNGAGAAAGAAAGCFFAGGGGLYFEQSGGTSPAELAIIDTQVISNTASGNGGGIYAWQYYGSPASLTITLTHSSIISNTAGAGAAGGASGGGIYFSGDSNSQPATLTLQDSSVAGNHAFGTEGGGGAGFGAGGGIYFSGWGPGMLSILDSAITDNSALGNSELVTSSGGGVHYGNLNGGADNGLRIENSVIARNVAQSGGGLFADINEAKHASVANSSIFANQALAATTHPFNGLGGGILVTHGILTVSNTTVSQNTAPKGGGLGVHSGGSLALVNATIHLNSASESGGGLYEGAGLGGTMANTVLSNNAGGNCYHDPYSTPVNSLGHNLSSDATCLLASPGDIVSTPAQLGPLQDNGGGTPTHAPLVGSPLLDAGDAALCPAADQRGVVRPLGAACDIGAVESAGAAPYVLTIPRSLRFVADKGLSILPPAQSVKIQNAGGGSLGWSASSSAAWLSVVPVAGTGAATAAVSVNPAGLVNGTYNGTITVTSPGAGGSPALISVTFVVAIPPTYCVRGEIVDPYGVKIPGVKVSAGNNRAALTDSTGRYQLCNLPAGAQTITATRADYTFTPASFALDGPPDLAAKDFQARWVGPAWLYAYPSYLAGIYDTIVFTLDHGPIGHQVKVKAINDLGQNVSLMYYVGDRTGNPVTLGADGRLYVTIGPPKMRMGLMVFVEDVTAGGDLPGSTYLAFYQSTQASPYAPEVPGITLDVNPTYPLDAAYLDDIGMDFTNKVTVKVNWNGRTPGPVEFWLNNYHWLETADARGNASHTFQLPGQLQPGGNVLSIQASSPTAGGEKSAISSFIIYRQSSPVWLTQSRSQGILTDARKSGTGYRTAIVWDFDYPLTVGPYTMGPFGIGGSTYFRTNLTGTLELLLSCHAGAFLHGGDGQVDLAFMGRTAGTERVKIETFDLRSLRGKDCALLPPAGSFVREAHQGNAKTPLAKKAWYDLLTTYSSSFASQPAVAGKFGTTQWTMDGDPKLTLKTEVRAKDEYPYWDLYDVSVSGDLAIQSPMIDIDAWAVDLSASATGRASFTRAGPFGGRSWEWDSLSLIGQAQGTFMRISNANPCTSSTPPGSLCLPVSQTQTVKGSINWRYPKSGWPLGAEPATADAGQAGMTALPSSSDGSDADLRASASTAAEVVAADVFTYTRPTLAVGPAGAETLLLWNTVDAAKPPLQGMEVSFSRKQAGSGWSAPAALTNDSLLDGAPVAAWAGDGKAIAVWPRLAVPLPAGGTIGVAEAKAFELVTASFDPAAGAWSAPTSLTTNDARDENVRLARNAAGQVLAVWRQNPAGLVRGTAADPDRIMAAIYDGGWGPAVEAAAGIPGVVDLVAGFGQGAATVAFTRELAPTGTVTPTLQLFTTAWDGTTWSAPVQRTDDDLGHRQPQAFYNDLNQPMVLWLAGDALRLQNLATGATFTLALPESIGWASTLEATQDAGGNILAVLSAAGSQSDLYLARYDRALGQWSSARPLTGDLAKESVSGPALSDTGALLLSYARTELTETTVTDVLVGTGEVYTYTVPSLGQTAVLALVHELGPNLTLAEGDLVVSDEHPAPGATVILTATVHNTGDTPVTAGSVGFYDGDPAAGGGLFATESLAGPLPGGGSAVLTASQTANPGRPLSRLYAVADPDGVVAETDESDNSTSVTAFGPDLSLEVIGLEYWGYGQVQIESLVRNGGTAASGETLLRFYRDAVTGTLTLTSTVPLLAPGEVYTTTSTWDSSGSAPGENVLIATVNWDELDFPEAATGDNAALARVAILPNLLVSPFTMRTEPAVGGGLTITVTVANGGLVDAPQADLQVLLDDPLTGTALFSATVPALAAGESVELSQVVTGLPSLPVTFYARVNTEAAFPEATIADNLAALAYGEKRLTYSYLPLIRR